MGKASYLSAIFAGTSAARSALPTLEDEATVTVVGAPGASKAEIWALAAAVGFSLVRRYDFLAEDFLPAGLLMVQYDAASNTVAFTIRYKTCLTTSTWNVGWEEISKIPVYGGPKNSVTGDTWNFISAVTGTPSDPADAGLWKKADRPGFSDFPVPTRRAPLLPFAGRPILTTSNICFEPNPAKDATALVPTPNPRPVVDYRSRSVAIDLVYSALTGPTGLGRKVFPPPVEPFIFKGA